ncbi:MAG TPA: DUF4157 domain-containing protein [Nocardioides sp.]|uniref:eCIS core domain-containing protein n=1 Tax=Nocardioides sp. TaxID=35761 RepID=UPI002B9B58E0|nr:DUF4157 domain-containing protein [Nocardioides sp.]HTW17760.1 DUF4157 domain-containing protein [Nocardioides sp.]
MPRTQYARPLLGDPLRRLVEDSSLEHETSEHESSEYEQPASGGLRVGAVDDREELDADRVADRVLARLAGHEAESEGAEHECAEHEADRGVRRTPGAGQVVGAAGGDLDSSSSAAIEGARGGGSVLPAGIRREMEAGFGHSLADVRIHTDERAAGLSRQMSARAFTTGRDIFFDKGEFSPGTTEGKRVLAHEIAHTRQDGGVRRKLRGTAQALESQGGGTTSGGVRKLVGKLTNWDKIVAGVKAYEASEAVLLNSGKNPGAATLMQAKQGLLKILTKVQAHIAEWRSSNDDDKQNAKQKSSSAYDTDNRTKAGRRQAVAMLAPRIGNEINLLTSSDSAAWTASLGLSDGKLTSSGEQDRGGVNTVQELNYTVEGSAHGGDDVAFSGFFKEDHGYNGLAQLHEIDSGIQRADPNYGARSVALYRLDQLLGADVTARAEFAVHTDPQGKAKMGTVLEKAKGTAASKLTYGFGTEHTKAMGPGAVNLDDEVLQRSINKLQILDVIAGQLDRHSGNYFIETDQQTGAVTGVTGIDLDMAFGADFTGTTHEDGAQLGAHNYRGMPESIDRPFAERLLQISPESIKAALTGLLSPAEIAATVTRFLKVQDAIRAADQAGQLVDKWDGSTARREKVGGAEITGRPKLRTQLQNLQFANLGTANKITTETLTAKLADCKDDAVRKALSDNLSSSWNHSLESALVGGFQDHEMSPDEVRAAVQMFVNFVNGPGKSSMTAALKAPMVGAAVDKAAALLMTQAVNLVVGKRAVAGRGRGGKR